MEKIYRYFVLTLLFSATLFFAFEAGKSALDGSDEQIQSQKFFKSFPDLQNQQNTEDEVSAELKDAQKMRSTNPSESQTDKDSEKDKDKKDKESNSEKTFWDRENLALNEAKDNKMNPAVKRKEPIIMGFPIDLNANARDEQTERKKELPDFSELFIPVFRTAQNQLMVIESQATSSELGQSYEVFLYNADGTQMIDHVVTTQAHGFPIVGDVEFLPVLTGTFTKSTRFLVFNDSQAVIQTLLKNKKFVESTLRAAYRPLTRVTQLGKMPSSDPKSDLEFFQLYPGVYLIKTLLR